MWPSNQLHYKAMKFITKLLATICIIIITAQFSFAQGYSITGKILDNKDNTSLINVSITITSTADSSHPLGTITDLDGNFMLEDVSPGKYNFRAAYVGYQTIIRTIIVAGSNLNVGTILMKGDNNTLKNVVVTGTQIRAQQLGDTTQFNADAYKTNPDATAEDLVTKMPGVTSDNSGVKVNGEAVQQVYVDGKPFFGTDPTLALKNLPSEVIDKIQVFDKLSDQAQFTGFDDGQTQKTINIITKKNKSNGQFGKIYAGYGTDNRYLAGGNINFFNGDQRISLIGLANNVNQQNFSSEDILGVTGGSTRGGRGRGGSRGAFGGGGNNFFVGQQGGITKTNSIGLNYTDDWGKKIKVTGSYFFNNTDNTNNTDLTRNYFTTSDSNLIYHEHDYSESKNWNHRFNLRFEYQIDSNNKLTIVPSLSFQNNDATSTLSGNDSEAQALTTLTNNKTTANNTGYSFNNNILYQHKFRKKGRTLSLNVGTGINEKSGDGSYYSSTQYFLSDTNSLLDQQYTLYNNSYNLSSSLVYTEPLGHVAQLMVEYKPSYTKSKSDKETSDKDPFTQQYTDFDTSLSNKYENTYTTQSGGLNLRIHNGGINLMAGADLQYATLHGEQTFPYTFSLDKNFTNVLPHAFFNYRFGNGKNLRVMYRTNTTAPSITQLQNVVDISNPLLLNTGNPNLKQDFENTVIVRYGLTKPQSGRAFFVFLYGNYIDNYIANATYIPRRDSIIGNGIKMTQGSQLTVPVNLSGYWNGRGFLTYGIPANFIKSNINLNGGFTITRSPGLINNALNYSNDYAPSAGVVIGSNISEDIDFTLSYSGAYNIIQNTVQSQLNSNYYSHTAAFRINWIFWKGVVLNTDITHTFYSTLTNNSGNESYFLWNAYLGYKFLKDKSLEARISAYDILNQNKSISRTVTDAYIENSTTQVLKQYFMFTLTYTLRNFTGTMPTENEEPMHDHPPMDGGHMPPPGGGHGFGGPPPGGPFN